MSDSGVDDVLDPILRSDSEGREALPDTDDDFLFTQRENRMVVLSELLPKVLSYLARCRAMPKHNRLKGDMDQH